MIVDGLWCSFEQCHMGTAGEVVATEYHIGRGAAGRIRRREPPQGRRRAGGRPLQGGDPAGCRSRRRRAIRWSFDRDESVRADTTAADARRAAAGIPQGRHRDRRQRAAGERRRRGARRDVGDARDRS